ncbi:noggin-2 [Exaiptasia diaphana]|uniref:Noggin n=1 Tax=Exaiptasia diaphana TaxID=2652724 RepID=A0A913X5Z6_EXADI|nr:noggin-2 [Exaiptasia diaphana]KXJ14942.1 Noggin [Exaiptasia diaphana]
MRNAVVVCVLLVVLPVQGVILSKRLPDSAGLLQQVKIKVQPKELMDECLNCQPSPAAHDMIVHNLKKIIGRRMDLTVVSITKPRDFTTSKLIKYTDNRQSKTRKMFLKHFVDIKSKSMIKMTALTNRQRTLLVDWLEEQSNCPMKLMWRDMGPHFWPRYVKRAHCVGKSCSVDPGMKCTASASRFFPLLRWFCIGAFRKNNLPLWAGKGFVERNGYICRWVKFPYPITTKCSCKCAS